MSHTQTHIPNLAIHKALLTGALAMAALAVLFISVAAATAQSKPNNDKFSRATEIATLPLEEPADLTQATIDEGEEGPGDCAKVANSVWYRYTPSEDTGVSVGVVPGAPTTEERFRPVVATYQGTSLDNLTALACLSPDADDQPVATVFMATAGETYYVKVASSARRGYTPGVFAVTIGEQDPSNDFFASAKLITLPFVDADVDTSTATNESSDHKLSECRGGTYNSVWYRFDAAEDSTLSAVAEPRDPVGEDSFDTVIAAYEGTSLDALAQLGCANENGANERELIAFPVTAGSTYYVQVGTRSGSAPGVFTFSADAQAQANDFFARPTEITTLPLEVSADLTQATIEAEEGPGDCARVENSIWYRYTPTEDTGIGVRVVPGTPQTDERFWPVIAAYQGTSVDALTALACVGPADDNLPASTAFLATAGETYYIKVASSARRGYTPGVFAVTIGEQDPGNDFFALAKPITLPFVDAHVDTSWATNESGDEKLSGCRGGTYNSVWYRFDATEDTTLSAVAQPRDPVAEDAFDVLMAAYEGASLDALTLLGCANENGANERELIAFPVTAGSSYYVQVGTRSGSTPGEFTFSADLQGQGNDFFSRATEIATLPLEESADLTQATIDEDEEGPGDCASVENSIWYRYTPAEDTGVRVRVVPGTPTTEERFRPVVGTYQGTAIDTLTALACVGPADDNLPASTAFLATAGETYYIKVASSARRGYNPGAFAVTIAEHDPNNDFFALAKPITLPFVDADVDTAWATNENRDEQLSGCRGGTYNSVWYRFDATEDRTIEAIVTPTAPLEGERFENTIAAYEGAALDGLTLIGCASAADFNEPVSMEIAVRAGATYHIQVGTWQGYTPGVLTFVVPADQAIAFDPLPGVVFGQAPFRVSATASSGKPVSFSAQGACSVSGDTVTIPRSGDCAITASQDGGPDGWNPAPDVTRSFTVEPAPQTIAFEQLPDATYGVAPLTLVATATSGLPVGFEGSDACSAEADQLTITAAGTCIVTASQPGDSGWAAAPDVFVTFEVAPATQSITFEPLPDITYTTEPISLSASADSGLPVAFTAEGTCSTQGTELFVIAAGDCTVILSQPGDAGWAPAADVRDTFVISTATQSITFEPLPDITYTTEPISLSASADSGLPVGFAADGTCTVAGSTLTLDAAGTCTVTASQPGDVGWSAAPDVSVSFSISPAAQTITFEPITAPPLGAPPVAISATASSGLPVSLEVSGSCALESDLLSVTAAGVCTVTASQPGDTRWAPASPVIQELEVAAPIDTTANMSGKVATTMPGTLVASGARITSLLDVGRRPVEYYSVALGIGQTLNAAVTATGHTPLIAVAYPDALLVDDEAAIAWTDLPASGWLAPEAGIYTVRVSDPTGGAGAYKYEIAFDVTEGGGPVSPLPTDGTPVTGTVNLAGAVATDLPGTLVATDASVTSLLAGERRPAEYFGIDLAIGDTLDVVASAGTSVRIAYPDALTSGQSASSTDWVPLEGTWLASEAGVYSIEVSDGGSGAPMLYTITFIVNGVPPVLSPAPVAEASPLALAGPGSTLLGSWRLTRLGAETVAEGVTITLVLGADGSVSGNGGCNDYGGTWSVPDDRFAMTDLVASSGFECDSTNLDLEADYLSLLPWMNTADIEDGGLVLTYNGSNDLTFTRAD